MFVVFPRLLPRIALLLLLCSCPSAFAAPQTAPSETPLAQSVSREEYKRAVRDFAQAIGAAEEARLRLLRIQPSDGKPTPIDCAFHPWRAGCQDLFQTIDPAQRANMRSALVSNLGVQGSTEGSDNGALQRNIFYDYLIGKAIDYVWDVGVCLYKADGPDGRGLEGPNGMKKFGNCFVEPNKIGAAGKWTDWLNRDAPGGAGDYETLREFVKEGAACSAPLDIECQSIDGQGWQAAGQVYTCSKESGGICLNREQPRGRSCKDYQVRFLCP